MSYGIKEGQIWKSRTSVFGDLKIIRVMHKSSLDHIAAIDLGTGKARVFNGYTIARLGLFEREDVYNARQKMFSDYGY